MMTISQEEFLNQTELQLEAQLKDVISVFQNLPESTLLKPAANKGWSIAECIEHLNTYAQYYLPRIEEAITQAQLLEERGYFKHSFIGKYFIDSMDVQRSTKKFKALKRHRPTEITNPRATVSTFLQHLENMLRLMKAARTKNLKKNSVATSISSWIKISPGDAMQFLLTHNMRHLKQASRNI